MQVIDLNSDLGEGFGAWKMGDDVSMLKIVSSANIACGFHAGDPLTIFKTVQEAARHSVAIGAHVSYPDRVGFGRRPMQMGAEELTADTIYQIGALQAMCTAAGTKVAYVKPHGALYNTIANDHYQAKAVIEGILAVNPDLVLMGLAGSKILSWAREMGLAVMAEAFADRAYSPSGDLLSRNEVGAVIHDPYRVAQRMLRLIQEGLIEAVDGTLLQLQADSICVHGDSPDAVMIAAEIRQTLLKHGVTIQPFSTSSV